MSSTNSHWVALLDNPETIRSVFQELPSLQHVRIAEVCFDAEGPSLKLRFDLNSYPNEPPKKWKVQEYNTVQVELAFYEIKEVFVHGWPPSGKADVDITKSDNGIRLKVISSECEIGLHSSFAFVSKMSAYTDSLREQP